MLVDMHTHAWPMEDIRVLGKRLAMFDGCLPDESPHKWYLRGEGTIEALVKSEGEAGIDRFVLLPVSSRPDKVSALNRWVALMAKKHEQIIPFGTLVPGSNRFLEDLDELIGLGLKGVKVHSFLQQLRMDSSEAEMLFAAIEEKGLPVVLDTMYLPGIVGVKPHLAPFLDFGLAFQTDVPVIHRIARRHPRLTIVAAHLGCLYGWEFIAPLYEQENVYFDLSYVSRLISPAEASNVIRRKGAERILFGTDAPWRSPKNAVAWFDSIDLTEGERRMIGADNFLNLLER